MRPIGPGPVAAALALCTVVRALASHAQGAADGTASSSATPARTEDGPAAGASTPPRLLRFVEAEYPAEARAAGTEATVVLLLALDAQGRVTDAQVIEGAGQGFDQAALAAVRRFEFEPARRNGQPVPARVRYRYRFTLRTAPMPQRPAALLRGRVSDERDRPIAGATVVLRLVGHEERRASTDAQGGFRFEIDAPGVALVSVEARGFWPYRAEEQIHARDDLSVQYRLRAQTPVSALPAALRRQRAGEDDPEEQGVTVRGSRPSREVTRTTLDRREIMRIPGTGGDALRAIQNLPGVARAPFLGGALVIRGASPADTQVFVDGSTLPLLYHFGGLSSVIQTEMLDRIDFYPGNYSARFGRAMGGIVDVGIRSPRRRGYRAVFNVSAIDASAFVEGAITPTLGFALAARRSYVDVILTAALANVEGIGVTAAPVYYDYQGVLEWRPNVRHRVRFLLLGDDDTLSILFRNPSDVAPMFAGQFSVATRFHIAQLLWEHDLGPGTQGRAMLSAGWTNLDFSASEQFRFGLQFFPLNGRYELSQRLSSYARLNAGMDIVAGRAIVQFSGLRFAPGETDPANAQRIASDIDGPVYQPATYLEAELTPTRTLRLVPSMRVDFDRAIHQAVLQPRFSFRWEFLRTTALRGGVGVYAQPPQFQQSSGAPNTFFPGQTLGNPSLGYQRAMHWGLGIEHRFSPWISLSVDGFYKWLDDLVVQAPSLALRGQMPPPSYSNAGVGRVYGMEVLLRHRASQRFFGWVAYTLLRSERRDAPEQDWHLFSQDQTHILTVVGSYNFGAGWEAGLRFRYVTGSPVTPYVGSFYNTDTATYTPIPGAPYSQRLGDFHQLDVRVDKTWRFRTWQFGVFLEVLNVYNRANPEGIQYNYNYTMSQPVNGLPIFPNLGLRAEF